MPDSPLSPAELTELRDGLNRVRDRNHTKDNIDATREAIELAVARALRNQAPAAQPPSAPVLPRWATVALSACGAVVTLSAAVAAVFAVFNAYAGYQVQARDNAARIAAVEAWKTEMTAFGLPAEIRELKNLSRTRDVQYQDLKDTIAGLRQSDAAGIQQIQELLRSLTAASTEIAGMRRELTEIREQMRRGSFYMPAPQRGNDEAPASLTVPRDIDA